MCPDLLTPASTPVQATHGDKARFKGADMRSGARAMLRKWGKRAADRFHRFYISFQNPKCLQETKSSRRLITNLERGDGEGLQGRVYGSEKEKHFERYERRNK